MIVHGKERKFRMTVGASAEIAKMCPNGDLRELGKIFTRNFVSDIGNIAKIIEILNHAEEEAHSYEDPTYTPDYMMAAEIMTLTPSELTELQKEAFGTIKKDSAQTVKTAPAKKKETKAQERSS